ACNKKGFLYNPNYWKSGDKYNKKIIATYDYKDEQGNLLYQVVRFYPKSFSQRRPYGNKGWIWNLKGISPALYQLPELIRSPNPVFLVEGEKDVNNLMKWGLTATTSPMGTGKWKREYNKYLKGRDVVLIPDNDESGYVHVKKIGQSLFGIAKSIKWLKLLGLSEKEDISDWIVKGNTKEELLRLTKQAPLFDLEESRKEQKELKKGNLKEEVKTLVPGLIHLVKDNDMAKYLFKKNNKLIIEEYYVKNDKK
ncbi:unnamed protein product, partial [marine sediment metagenome]